MIEITDKGRTDHGYGRGKMTGSVEPNPVVETVTKRIVEPERIIIKRKKIKKKH